MTLTNDAIRWLDHEAGLCRDRDAAEALCLVLPALRQYLNLPPMDDLEARAFRERLKEALTRDLKQEAA